jgi:hypothetical protein
MSTNEESFAQNNLDTLTQFSGLHILLPGWYIQWPEHVQVNLLGQNYILLPGWYIQWPEHVQVNLLGQNYNSTS